MKKPIDAKFEVIHDPRAELSPDPEPPQAGYDPLTGPICTIIAAAIVIPLFMFVVTPWLRRIVSAWLGAE